MADLATILAPLTLLLIFALARVVAHYTIVYRRNNLGVCAALVLSAVAVYVWSWLGLLSFAAGTIYHAWTWLCDIRDANQKMRRGALPRSPESTSAAHRRTRTHSAPRLAQTGAHNQH